MNLEVNNKTYNFATNIQLINTQNVKQSTDSTSKKLTRFVILTVLVIMIIVFSASCWICHQALMAEAHARYVGITNVAAEKIAKTIRGMEMNAMNEFDEVEKHLDTPESVIAALESKTNLNPEVRGYFAAFEPHYFEKEGQWFEPYVHHVDTNAFELRMVGSARHNYHKSEWYIRAKQSNDSFWADPYYYYDGTNISGHYTTFVKPIFDKTGRLACVCGADMTFEWLSKELERIEKTIQQNELLNRYLFHENDCYTVIINNDGSCIAHPVDKLLTMTKEQAGDIFDQQKSGTIEMNINGVASTIYYTPIEHVKWSAALIVPKQGVLQPMLKIALIFLLIGVFSLLAVWKLCRRIVQ